MDSARERAANEPLDVVILTTNEQDVACWACQATLQVPVVDGAPAAVFKCGWCGALTRTDPGEPPKYAKRKGCCSQVARSCKWCSSTGVGRLLLRLGRYLIVLLVTGAIVSVAAVGFLYLLPALFTGVAYTAHLTFSSLVAFNLAWNFTASLLQNPGSPAQYMHIYAFGQVPQGAYNNCTYCRRCRFLKPARAHHCSTCGQCVLNMDHHCPFINSCVGAGNARSFLLFLLWLLLGCGYVIGLTAALMHRRWSACVEAAADTYLATPADSLPQVLTFSMRMAWNAPAWLSALFFELCMSAGALVGVGILFAAQLRLALRGQTYINQLQYGEAAEPRRSAMTNLRSVFGQGHPLLWLWPRWRRPRAAFAGGIESKRQ